MSVARGQALPGLGGMGGLRAKSQPAREHPIRLTARNRPSQPFIQIPSRGREPLAHPAAYARGCDRPLLAARCLSPAFPRYLSLALTVSVDSCEATRTIWAITGASN